MMRTCGRIVLTVMLSVAALALVAVSAPDLVVVRIESQPSAPIPGSTALLTAVLENIGATDAHERFYVQFAVDGRKLDPVAVPLGLRAGEQEEVTIPWTVDGGSHTLSAEVDSPFGRISESNEKNNQSSIVLVIPTGTELADRFGSLRVVLARLEDRSQSGFVNVGEGVADKLAWLLDGSGIRVLDRHEFEAILQQQALNPALIEDLASAARMLGANLLITGVVSSVDLQKHTVGFGILGFTGASATVSISAQLFDVRTAEPLSPPLPADGHQEGMTGFSVDLSSILALPGSFDVCAGGLMPDRSWYMAGETVPLGYLNPSSAGWYSVEIYSSTDTFLRWLGWRYIDTGDCGQWTWNQRDSAGFQVPPAVYVAKLRNGTSYMETTSFQIRPGLGLSIGLAGEITVGSDPFEQTIVGDALNQAVDELASSLVLAFESAAPRVAAVLTAGIAQEERLEQLPPSREGQIAAMLPDERIAINIGASSGVTRGDFYQVLATENRISDPQTLEIQGYDVLAIKGELVVVEVRDRVSYAMKTSDFEALIGDIVRPLSP